MTGKEEGFYHTPAWRKVRQLALHRDNYLCQWCLKNGRISRAEEVHHIEGIDESMEKRLSLDNLVSLCRECQDKTKLNKGRKKKNAIKPRARVIKM